MKKVLAIVITILLVVGIILGWVYLLKQNTNEPIFTLENYPKVDASLAIHPLASLTVDL